uniref:Peptidase S9 prolyl oligopeptidase catalytic domain-containing protein n=1 Tax=Parascaris univalens TaxID=6257 RepID=A0A915AH56_PARUN
MLYNLIDDVNFTIKNGIAKRSQIAIIGGSYDNYAALIGMTLTPNVFACGVDVVGSGREFLRSRSALFFADGVRKPVIILQGANDPRLGRNESDQFVAALKVNNIPITYILYPDEGHGLRKQENALAQAGFAEKYPQRIRRVQYQATQFKCYGRF